MFSILAALSAVGVVLPGALVAQPIPTKDRFSFSAAIGYEASKLVWNVGQNRGRRSSQLAYRGLSISSAEVTTIARLWDRASGQGLIRVRVEAGRILDGTIRDSDGQPGKAAWLSTSEATGKSTATLSASLGWYHALPELQALEGMGFWLGYDWTKRIIRMQNGEQILPRAVPGDILEGLDSHYRARWMGPWFGVEPTLTLRKVQLTAQLAFHFLNQFRAQGRWNLRPDLAQPKSFVQKSVGLGLDVGLHLRYPVTEDLFLTLRGSRSRFTALWGDDTYFRANGQEGSQNLRSVGLTSTRAHIGISWRF